MLRKMRYLTGITAVLFAVAVSFLISGKVYAGGDPEPCGENVSYNTGGTNFYIELDDKSKGASGDNAMYDYEYYTERDWDDISDQFECIQIDYGVKHIGRYAFYGMSNVETIYFPNTIESIGEDAFTGCNSIKKIVYYGSSEEWQKFKNSQMNTDTTFKNKELFNPFITMEYRDLGTLIVNLSNGSFDLSDKERHAFENTMNWLYINDYIFKSEEPVVRYNLDNNSVDGSLLEGNDISVNVIDIDNWKLELASTTNLENSTTPIEFKEYNNKTIYNSYFPTYGLPSYSSNNNNHCYYYYSSIVFLFSQDMGELEIDLTDGICSLDKYEKELFENFLYYSDTVHKTYCSMNSMTIKSLVHLYYDSSTKTYSIDFDSNGSDDFYAYMRDDGCSITRSIAPELYKYMVSFDTDFNNFIKSTYMMPYFSSVKIRFRDTVYPVDEKPATCEEDGYEAYYHSTDNDNIYSDEDALYKIEAPVVIPKLGHDWGDWTVVKEPTVDEEGLEERVCKNDPTHKEQKPIDKLPPTPTPEPTPTPTLSATPTPTPSQYPDVEIEPKPERKDQMGIDGTAFSNGASDEAVEKAILNYSSEEDPAGTTYSGLQAKASKVTKTYIKLAWKKVDNAKSYVIYANKCGAKNKYLKLTTIKNNSYKATKVAGSKIKKGTYYKFLIVALDADNNVISTSKTIHAATTGGKVGNDKSVTTKAKKNKVSVKVGKTFKLKAKTKAASKKLKVKKHRAIKYESSDPAKATVSDKGVITGVSKGTCYVYAYAQNGVCAKIKVTIK